MEPGRNFTNSYLFGDMDADILGERILLDLKNAFKKDPLIDEFDILPAHDSVCNKCPVIHVEHKIALEDWCVKHVYIFAYSNFLKWRQHSYKIDSDTLLGWTSVILLINPEIVTAWNARKELSCQKLQSPMEELKFSEIVLSRKPKSSQVFAHRKWVLLEFQKSNPSPCALQEVTEHEFSLCTRIADRYPNNYYAWSHRMWIMQELLNVCLKVVLEELLRMEQWVSAHISDYSGFHYRQFLMSCFSNACQTNSQSIRNCVTCPIHINLEQVCDCSKGDTDGNDQHSVHYHNILEQELTLLTELQIAFPGHEALWNHRRFVIRDCCRLILIADSYPTKLDSIESVSTESMVQCKRHKLELNCCVTVDWNPYKEDNFINQCMKLSKNNDWEMKLISMHVTWLKNVISWSCSHFASS